MKPVAQGRWQEPEWRKINTAISVLHLSEAYSFSGVTEEQLYLSEGFQY